VKGISASHKEKKIGKILKQCMNIVIVKGIAFMMYCNSVAGDHFMRAYVR
jgi:hypothetical protein